MKWFICLLLTTALYIKSDAQINCKLHIVTTWDNRLAGFKLQCTINGKPYKLLPGKCMELQVQADSIHIIMTDTRWVKNETVDLHVKSEEDLYVHLLWGHLATERKSKIRSIAEVVCKSCFDVLKKKCRKTIAG